MHLRLFATVCSLCCLVDVCQTLERPSPRIVTLARRQLRGVERSVPFSNRTALVDIFYQVHYGFLEDGVARFLPAQKQTEEWVNVRYKADNRLICPQNMPPLDFAVDAPSSDHEQPVGDLYSAYLEQLYVADSKVPDDTANCLTLNLFVPVSQTPVDELQERKLPVVLYVHGDSTMYGSGNMFDACEFAVSSGTIFITFNYRVGVLGFFEPANMQQQPISIALYDLNSALTWINENIAYFGGDPARVTVLGDHRGAALVNAFLLAPDFRATELVSKVVLLQSNLLSPDSVMEPERVREFNDKLLVALRCRRSESTTEDRSTPRPNARKQSLVELLCLANRSTSEIRNAELNVSANPRGPAFQYGPLTGARVGPREQNSLLKSLEQLRKIPLMLLTSKCIEFDHDVPLGGSLLKSEYRVMLEAMQNYLGDTALDEVFRQVLPFYFRKPAEGGAQERLMEFLSDAFSFVPQTQLADLMRSKANNESSNVFLGEFAFRCSSPAATKRPASYFFGYSLNLLFGRRHFDSHRTRVSFVREDVRQRFHAYFHSFLAAQPGRSVLAAQSGEMWPAYQIDRSELMHFDMINNKIFKRRISLAEAEKVRSWNRILMTSGDNSSCGAANCNAVDFLRVELQQSESYRHSHPRFTATMFPNPLRTSEKSPRMVEISNRSTPNASFESVEAQAHPDVLYASLAKLIVVLAVGFAALFIVANVVALGSIYQKRRRQRMRFRKPPSVTMEVKTENLNDNEVDTVNNSADTQFSSLLSSAPSDSQQTVHQFYTPVNSAYCEKNGESVVVNHNTIPRKAGISSSSKQIRFDIVDMDDHSVQTNTHAHACHDPEIAENTSTYRHTLWDDRQLDHVLANNSRVRQKNVVNSFQRFDSLRLDDLVGIHEEHAEDKKTQKKWHTVDWRLQPLASTTML